MQMRFIVALVTVLGISGAVHAGQQGAATQDSHTEMVQRGVRMMGFSAAKTTHHFMLLQRNLIYTGITRGKRLLVLIGQK